MTVLNGSPGKLTRYPNACYQNRQTLATLQSPDAPAAFSRHLGRVPSAHGAFPPPSPHLPRGCPCFRISEDVERTVALTYSGRHTSGPSPSTSAWRYWNSIHYPSIGDTMDVQVTEAVGVTFHAGSTQEIPSTVPLGFSASDGGTPL